MTNTSFWKSRIHGCCTEEPAQTYTPCGEPFAVLCPLHDEKHFVFHLHGTSYDLLANDCYGVSNVLAFLNNLSPQNQFNSANLMPFYNLYLYAFVITFTCMDFKMWLTRLYTVWLLESRYWIYTSKHVWPQISSSNIFAVKYHNLSWLYQFRANALESLLMSKFLFQSTYRTVFTLLHETQGRGCETRI